jgi:hypothetical protein
MDLVSLLVRCQLAERRMPSLEPTVSLTAVGPDEIEPSGLPNRTIQFSLFQEEAFSSCSFGV